MSLKMFSERLAGAMERPLRNWDALRKAEAFAGASAGPAGPALTIAISRQAGARGREVARALGERLNWPVFDKELLQRVAGEMGLRAELLESMDEKRHSWLQDCLEAFTSKPTVSQPGYIRRLVEVVLSLAAHGGCVILGRGAAQVLPAAATLRVRLIGSLRERVEVVRARLGCTPAEAEAWIAKTDLERTRFVRDHFHRDPDDPQQYDLVLNAFRFPVEACVDLIVQALRHLEAAVRGRKMPAAPG